MRSRLKANMMERGELRMKPGAKINFEIIKSLFAIMGYKRQEISFSGLHVLFITECFYEHMPFSMRRHLNYKQLKYGALLHDIGKISISEDVLNKAGKLSGEEMELVRGHAGISAEILSSIQGMESVSKWIQYHHERMDGKGYYHLKGKEIPFEARVIAITDAYASIIMASAFKPSRTHEDAVSILNMEAGTQFDEEMIRVFCKIPSGALGKATKRAVAVMKGVGNFFPQG